MNNLTILTYTHSSCSDIHKMYFDSFEKYFNNVNHIVLVNSPINDGKITEVIYDELSDYYEQMLLGLSKIKTEYLIYSQEDYILYDFVNNNLIKKYVELLDNNKDIMFIRLINAGLNGSEKDYDDDFVVIDNNNDYYFSTQITIWKKEHLKKMFELSKVESVFDEPKNSPFLKSLNKVGLCTKLLGDKIESHFNSVIYPYIATAIVKGKWNFSEYERILLDLFKKYNIDYNIRGVR